MSAAKYLKVFINRNPRNMERLRLQRKTDGWDFEKNRFQKSFIYKVDLHTTGSATTAIVSHYEDGPVIEASTNEKAVKAQLYSPSDVSAAYNIGRLLARRCLMAGVNYLTPTTLPNEGSQRMTSFLKALEESGIELEEPNCIPHTHLNDPNLTWEPFEYNHTREDKLDEVDLSLEPGKGVC